VLERSFLPNSQQALTLVIALGLVFLNDTFRFHPFPKVISDEHIFVYSFDFLAAICLLYILSLKITFIFLFEYE